MFERPTNVNYSFFRIAPIKLFSIMAKRAKKAHKLLLKKCLNTPLISSLFEIKNPKTRKREFIQIKTKTTANVKFRDESSRTGGELSKSGFDPVKSRIMKLSSGLTRSRTTKYMQFARFFALFRKKKTALTKNSPSLIFFQSQNLMARRLILRRGQRANLEKN